MLEIFKKLVLISTISASIVKSSKKNIVLEQIPSNHYLFYFLKNIADIKALIDSNNEIKTIILVYAASLYLII